MRAERKERKEGSLDCFIDYWLIRISHWRIRISSLEYSRINCRRHSGELKEVR